MTRRTALLTATVVLAAAPPAAAAVWPPSTISAGGSRPHLAFTGGGTPVISASFSSGFSIGQERIFTGPGTPLRTELLAPPAPFGSNEVAYLRTTTPERPAPRRATVGVSLGTPRTLGRFRLLSRRARGEIVYGFGAAIASNRRGNVAVAWEEPHGRHEHLMISLRRPGREFSKPSVLVGSGLVSSITLAMGPSGDLVVAFQRSTSRGRRVMARIRPGNSRFGPLETIGPSDGFSDIDADVSRGGGAVVAYGTQDGGEEANKPWVVRAAVKPGDRGAFGPTTILDPGAGIERPAGTVNAEIAGDGTATVAWSSILGAQLRPDYPARVATALPGRAFGVPQPLASTAAVTDLAVREDGLAIVVWGILTEPGNNQQSDQVFANLRPPGAAAFGAPEPVSPRERGGQARVAFNPRTGIPSVAWIGEPGSPPLGQPPLFPRALRYAERLP